jgi:predicted TIM-barrel fold metal-dependent hydrolase
MPRTYPPISSDSHLEIPPERWTHRVPAQYRDLAPRRITLPDGGDALVIAGSAPIENASDLYARRPPARWLPMRLSYAETAGTGPPEQRLAEQDEDGVEAEVLFPAQVAGPALWRRIEDETAYLAMVRAYNEWLAEEYCAAAPDRLIGLGVMPWTCLDGVVAELENCARLGFKGVALGTFPNGEGYPTPEDDRFWAAALDLDLPVAIHVELRRHGHRAKQPTFRYPREPEEIARLLAPDRFRTVVDRMARFGMAAALTLSQLTIAGLFERFPRLHLFMAETRVGWLPYWLENADLQYERNRGWCEEYLGFQPLQRRPSEYVKEHVHWSIQSERVGLELRHHLGVDKIMFATDFPHIECDYPNTAQVIEDIYADVPEDERYQILRGNVTRFFRLPDRAAAKAPSAAGADRAS